MQDPKHHTTAEDKLQRLIETQCVHIGPVEGFFGTYSTRPKEVFKKQWHIQEEIIPHPNVIPSQEQLNVISRLTRDQLSCLWTVEEMNLSRDDCKKNLSDPNYYEPLMAFLVLFKSIDIVVEANLQKAISRYPEIESMLDTVAYVETIHNRAYQKLVNNSILEDPTRTFEENESLLNELECTLEEISLLGRNLLVDINYASSSIPIFVKLNQKEMLQVYDCMTEAGNYPIMTRTMCFAFMEYSLLLLFNLFHKLSFIDENRWKSMHELNELVAIDETIHVKLGQYIYRNLFLNSEAITKEARDKSMKQIFVFADKLLHSLIEAILKKLPEFAMGFERKDIIDCFHYRFNRFLDETFKDYENYEQSNQFTTDPLPILTLKEKILDQNSFFERKGTYPDLKQNDFERYLVEVPGKSSITFDLKNTITDITDSLSEDIADRLVQDIIQDINQINIDQHMTQGLPENMSENMSESFAATDMEIKPEAKSEIEEASDDEVSNQMYAEIDNKPSSSN